MAIYEDGKLKGKLGSVVYRTVNGKTVVQAYPKRPKDGYPTTKHNVQFGVAARAASGMYRQLKDFALNLTMRNLYSSLNGLFIREFKHLRPAVVSERWALVPGSLDLQVGRRSWLEDLVESEIVMRIKDTTCQLRIPPLNLHGGRFSKYRIWSEVQEMELAFTLLHYDFETDSASVVARWISGRFPKNSVPGAVDLDCDLLNIDGDLIENGLLLGCVGLRLFASETSDSYLNTSGFNPFSIVGVWAKG
ncbi:hypothetical protein [Albibacterium profundi]|uniref:Uncharacterized protein n=1 Tax=Albibacterium profundi TaxID=3134906 RepID=A0ABV5C9N8_9SPHI